MEKPSRAMFDREPPKSRSFTDRQAREISPASREVAYGWFRLTDPVSFERVLASHGIMNEIEPRPGLKSVEPAVELTADFARCFFLRPANQLNYALDR